MVGRGIRRIPARDFDVDSTTVTAVLIPMFALGGLLAAIGLIVAGRATLRARRWDGWGRFTPLGLGIAALATREATIGQ